MNKYFSFKNNDFSYHYSFDEKPKKSNFKMHTHTKCELYLFLKGKGVFKVEGNEYELKSGDILIMRESEAHYIDINQKTPYERMAINFTPDYFKSIDTNSMLTEPFYKRDAGKLNLYRKEEFNSDVYKLLINNLLNTSDCWQLSLTANLIPLLYEIRRIWISRDGDEIQGDSKTHKIINYIKLHLFENLTLDTISKEFYISKPQLCKIFKCATGTTVQNYISVKRLYAAYMALCDGTPPQKAAIECGYNDYSVFYRAFKKQYGITPKSAYKKDSN